MTYEVESRYQEPLKVPWIGGQYEYVGPTTTRLFLTAADGYLRILVRDEHPRRQYCMSATTLTNDLAVAGPGGLHNNFAIAPGDYAIRGAWDSLTARRNGTRCLFAVPDGTVINAALMAQLGLGNYDMWSSVIAVIEVDAGGAIVPFPPILDTAGAGGTWTWLDPIVQVLTNGVAIATTAIDLTGNVPGGASLVALRITTEHNGVLEAQASLYAYDGATDFLHLTLPAHGSGAGLHRLQGANITMPMLGTLANSVRYVWSIAPTVGANVWVLGYFVPA